MVFIPGAPILPNLRILVGALRPDDALGAFTPSLQPGEIFTDYHVHNYYWEDQHVYMLPVAGTRSAQASEGSFSTRPPRQPFPGANIISATQRRASAAFVQLAAPTLLWIADWTAARLSAPPVTPSPESRDTNWILLDEHYNPAMITVAADGRTPLYRISGTFVYGHRNPNADLTASLTRFPLPPWLQGDFQRSYSNEFQRQGIID